MEKEAQLKTDTLQMEEKFKEKLKLILAGKNGKLETVLGKDDFARMLQDVIEAQNCRENKSSLTAKQYRRLKRFDVMSVGGVEYLICAKTKPAFKYFVTEDECFEILHSTHVNTGHKRLRLMEKELNKNYCNITRDVIDAYLQLCNTCQVKSKHPRKGLAVKPMIFDEMNSRCQVDLIDMQSDPDNEYRHIMVYQDHLTKFVFLKPLKTKTAMEVGYNLIDIFSIVGAPMILQSDNGRKFVNQVIDELKVIWEGLKIVHGKPRHSQSQGSVERANQDVRDMLIAWQEQNNTKKWSEGLKFVQFQKNRSFHEGIKRSPYMAMFGAEPRLGLLDSKLPKHVAQQIGSEEELQASLNEAKKTTATKSEAEDSENEAMDELE